MNIKSGMLTGKVRGRKGRFGKVIMQVQIYDIKSDYLWPNAPKDESEDLTNDDYTKVWIDATEAHIYRTYG